MPRRRFTTEQIVSTLRAAEVLLTQTRTAAEVCRAWNVSARRYYRWRKEHGGMGTDQARRQRELEKENGRLKKLAADLSLDNAILKETVR